MRRVREFAVTVIILATWILVPAPGNAVERGYQEEFTTTEYEDALNTTAWWDTTATELKLWPFQSYIMGSCDTPGGAISVAVSGDVAYVADYGSGLQVIDVVDPAHPTIIGSCDMPGYAHGVVVSGDVAYVANGANGLKVVDVSDPRNPAIIGSRDTYDARCVAVSGDVAYVADRWPGILAIDVSDPANPTIVGSCGTPDNALGVAVSGDVVYVAAADSGLQVIDVSQPAHPTIIGSYPGLEAANGVAVSGDLVYVSMENIWGFGLAVVDVADPTNPSLIGVCLTPGDARLVSVSGDVAYVTDSESGLQVIDVSDPTHPVIIDSCDTPGVAYGVSVAGNVAYVADWGSGLQVIGVSNPVRPATIGSCGTPDQAFGVSVCGDLAYVAAENSGLQVIDVSDPANPAIIGGCDTPHWARGVAVAGNVAYVGDTFSGLQVIDVSDPANPAIIGSCDTPDAAAGVAVSGDVAYVTDYSSLKVIDVSDPTSPVIIGSCSTAGGAVCVAVSGDVAYVADTGLQVIDVSDPVSPAIIGSCNTPDLAQGVAVSGDVAYVADRYSGLQVIDVSDPAHPAIIGSCDTPNLAQDVAVAGDVVYVADGDSIQVIDVSDPANPAIIGGCDTPGSTWRLSVAGDLAYVTTVDGLSLEVIRVAQRELDIRKDTGQSLAIDDSGETIPRARMTATQTETVTWELTVDGGTTWQGFIPDGNWNAFTSSGADLRWRSTLALVDLGSPPSVSDLAVEWLYEFAPIDSILDVPEDQGGWVAIHFTRSGYDFADEDSLPITGYQIYRRVDDAAFREQVLEAASIPHPSELVGSPLSSFSPSQVRVLGDERFVLGGGEAGTRGELPPGTWQVLAWVAARQDDSYNVAVPTLGDSTENGVNWSVNLVTTHTTTPSIWFVSEPDSGYSVDNIAPAIPTNLRFGSPGVLEWDPAPEEDFAYHTVYGSEKREFDETATLIGHTVVPTFDVSEDPFGYYHVTTSDAAGNEGDPATIESDASGTPESDPIPSVFALGSGRPSPFRYGTTIAFDLPVSDVVRLVIYDASGRQVRVLTNGRHTPGRHRVVWNGTNEIGQQVGPGVYFARMQAGSFLATRRLVLAR